MAELEPEEQMDWYNVSSTGDSAQSTAVFLGEAAGEENDGNGEEDVLWSTHQSSSRRGGPDEDSSPQMLDTLKSHMGQQVATQLWHAGRQSTEKLINTYGHIDILRPYFDVEPAEFRDRLIKSCLPSTSVGAPQDVSAELYGPTMLVFTLVAVLLYGMKTSGHTVEEGTLIGTALVVCLGYWIGVSAIVGFFTYLLTAHFSLLQILSLMGYSLTGHCLVLALSTVCDHVGLPGMFYLFWPILGGLTGLRMVGVYISRSWTLRDGLVLSAVAITFHLLSILYLRLAYHRVYEVVADVL